MVNGLAGKILWGRLPPHQGGPPGKSPAHRLQQHQIAAFYSTVRDADQILMLDRGRIAERGTHDQLIRQNGIYAELHRKQLLEDELAAS